MQSADAGRSAGQTERSAEIPGPSADETGPALMKFMSKPLAFFEELDEIGPRHVQ